MTTYYEAYQKVLVSVDCIIFGFDDGELKVLIGKRKMDPGRGQWSLYGGFIGSDEGIDDAANRVLFQLTGLKNIYMRQVGAFGKVDRDPGERVISIAYYALINVKDYDSKQQELHGLEWMPIKDLPQLYSDHNVMVRQALKIMQGKISREPISFNLLPKLFTLTQLQKLYEAFVKFDASLLETNPVAVLRDGAIVALDAKMSFDNNALYRHKNISMLQDEYEEEDRELKAAKYGFQYSEFDGNIGCIVNGDGIALAAMDLIRTKGNNGTACFLNVKGGVDKDKIAAGIKIIMTNPRVEGILINILGGFLRCNLIADGIVAAASEVGLNVPLVVRFEGTNKDEAKDILEHSKLPIIIAEDMEDSVDKLIEAMEESD